MINSYARLMNHSAVLRIALLLGCAGEDAAEIDPNAFQGVYVLESTLGLGSAVPSSVLSGLEILGQLTDDAEEVFCGSGGGDAYGTDPGACVLDAIMRQTCHWECLDGENYDTCSEINHPFGNVQALCEQNFFTWSGQQRRILAGCGVWETSYEDVEDMINGQLLAVVPNFVPIVEHIAEDLTGAIRNARVLSVLTVDQVNGSRAIFIHELQRIVVQLRDGAGDSQEYRADLADAGVSSLTANGIAEIDGRSLVLPEHSFELDYGELVHHLYQEGVLQGLLGFPGTREMLRSLIDCTPVTQYLAPELAIVDEPTLLGYCLQALDDAADAIDDQIANNVDESGVLTMSGVVLAGDIDPNDTVTFLKDGMWQGIWEEGAETGTVAGDFIGLRN